jgi:hypothetical protein
VQLARPIDAEPDQVAVLSEECELARALDGSPKGLGPKPDLDPRGSGIRWRDYPDWSALSDQPSA